MPHGRLITALMVTLCRASVRADGPHCTSFSGSVASCTRLVVNSSRPRPPRPRAFDHWYQPLSCQLLAMRRRMPMLKPSNLLAPMLMFIVGFAGLKPSDA